MARSFDNSWYLKKRQEFIAGQKKKMEEIYAKYRFSNEYPIEFHEDATKYGYAKYPYNSWWQVGLFGTIFQAVLGIALIVVGTLIIVFSWGTGTALGVSLIFSGAGMMGSAAGNELGQGKAIKKAEVEMDTAMAKVKAEWRKINREKAAAQLSDNIIYNAYDIYANGRIFNQGQAGDMNTYSPTKAYDANKGILGENRAENGDEFSEAIMNRDHIDLGGNAGFTTRLLGLPFQAASDKGVDYSLRQKQCEAFLKIDVKQVNKMMEELTAEGFGLGRDLEAFYEDFTNHFIGGDKARLDSAKFLEKMQSYRNAQFMDFDLKNFYYDKKTQKENELTAILDSIREWDGEEARAEREDMDDLTLAFWVIQNIKMQVSVISNYVEGSYIWNKFHIEYGHHKVTLWEDWLSSFESKARAFDSAEVEEGGSLELELQRLARDLIFWYSDQMPRDIGIDKLWYAEKITNENMLNNNPINKNYSLYNTIKDYNEPEKYVVFQYQMEVLRIDHSKIVGDGDTYYKPEPEIIEIEAKDYQIQGLTESEKGTLKVVNTTLINYQYEEQELSGGYTEICMLKTNISAGKRDLWKKTLNYRITDARFEEWLKKDLTAAATTETTTPQS